MLCRLVLHTPSSLIGLATKKLHKEGVFSRFATPTVQAKWARRMDFFNNYMPLISHQTKIYCFTDERNFQVIAVLRRLYSTRVRSLDSNRAVYIHRSPLYPLHQGRETALKHPNQIEQLQKINEPIVMPISRKKMALKRIH